MNLNPWVEDNEWLTDALCRRMVLDGEAHPSWWDSRVAGETTKQRAERHERAKAVCRQCPVQLQCKADTDPERDEGVRFAELLPELRIGQDGRRCNGLAA